MADATRPPGGVSDATHAFAQFITVWCRMSGELIDALVEARAMPGGAQLTELLMGDPMILELIEGWQIWEEWTGVRDSTEGDARLVEHLPPRLIRRLRFALWGWGGPHD